MIHSKSIHKLIETARGDRPADLLLRNASLINVFSGAVEKTHIAVAGGRVAGFGHYNAHETVDLHERFVAPGFIDAHVHIESSMVCVTEFARTVLPRGTTAVVADPHEIANVLGTAGIQYMLDASQEQPLHFFFSLPSCVPATHMESAGAHLAAADLEPFMGHPRIKALAEMMNFPGVIYQDPDVLTKIHLMQAQGKPVDGHAPGLYGQSLHAYLIAGIGSDHECTTADEAREKLSAGMRIMVRQGTGARNLSALLPMIDERNARRMMWCTDDRHPHDLLDDGHIDTMIRQAVKSGLDPIIAIQMATLNPAEYFGLNDLGTLAPGRRADMVIFDDLNCPVIDQVYVNGELAAQGGMPIPGLNFPMPAVAPTSMQVPLQNIDFSINAHGSRIRVIRVIPDQIITQAQKADACIVENQAVADIERDILKIAVVERHHGTGRVGKGFIRGFGLQQGALASTVAHDSHNIVVVGANDSDMHQAVAQLVQMGGGLAAVADGRVLARLPLPIAGLMSDATIQRVRHQLDELMAVARQMGTTLVDPFMKLSFMALPVIPALKITDHGLVDVDRFEIVPLFVD